MTKDEPERIYDREVDKESWKSIKQRLKAAKALKSGIDFNNMILAIMRELAVIHILNWDEYYEPSWKEIKSVIEKEICAFYGRNFSCVLSDFKNTESKESVKESLDALMISDELLRIETDSNQISVITFRLDRPDLAGLEIQIKQIAGKSCKTSFKY